jgi:hypothetical protein
LGAFAIGALIGAALWRERQHSRYGPTLRDKLMQPKRILELVSFTLG